MKTFAIVIAFFYLIQLVRFLTIPLRTRLEETEEVRRAKRLFMMVVKALMAAG
ncbi:AAEL013447-PA [Aedes aegypti]|uniref:AAEL013447-PA n=1 Tax=Aedes aegypti TaxID=7159 RepID=Q16J47_AEDAE|nr:AAEL013447-PA [Aedes aegypti]